MVLIVLLLTVHMVTQTAADSINNCSDKRFNDIISMPLLDNLQATLKADIDVGKMKTYFTEYINQEVKIGVQTAMKDLVEEMVNNRTNKVKDSIRTMFKEIQPIAFFARLDKTLTNLPTSAVVILKNVITNEGKAYNPATGKFTCPEDGVFNFGWTFLTHNGKRFNTELVVDGTAIAYNHNEATGITNHKAASHSAVVNLKRGNKAWIRTHSNHGEYAFAQWSSFSGFRL